MRSDPPTTGLLRLWRKITGRRADPMGINSTTEQFNLGYFAGLNGARMPRGASPEYVRAYGMAQNTETARTIKAMS